MDIGQILANGGVITVLGGILYKLQERRLKQIEDKNQQLDDQKVTKEICEERHENQKESNDKIEKRLDKGNEIMGKLDTTTALLIDRVERLFKEVEKQNGNG